jgi:hypothetical protein
MHKSHKRVVAKENSASLSRAPAHARTRDLQAAAAAAKSVPAPSILNRWDQSPCNLPGADFEE